MIIAVVGSRGFSNLKAVEEYIETLPLDTIVVSGGAKGVDKTAENAAIKRGIRTLIYNPDWKKNGKAAGFIRNQDIVDAADKVVVFWDGISKGTKHTMDLATKAGKSVELK